MNKYTLRNANLLHQPFCRKEFSKFSINHRAPYLWNNLVQGKFDLPDVPSLSSFKYHLKKALFSIEDILIYF